MKNTSQNPFWAQAKLERGRARFRNFMALIKDECEVVVRSDGHEEIDILLGNKSETALTYVTLDIQEAKEFANILRERADVARLIVRCNARPVPGVLFGVVQ